ncbi:hypothetical protein [Flavobacterium ginsenosidimutans]|uniref:Uncharacterized protein n=1 Tax=Flavobacterium ginsenosidimutans TaxID=687844 RepID=A0ABZ2Q4H7_9FLAO|nr:hypothetical protein [Flavobacterium ginsenosidimutans]KAF2328054.1 hypothetical protein DM444_19855 [Flavobacterium ginsenosidimutans]
MPLITYCIAKEKTKKKKRKRRKSGHEECSGAISPEGGQRSWSPLCAPRMRWPLAWPAFIAIENG